VPKAQISRQIKTREGLSGVEPPKPFLYSNENELANGVGF
jgi:hypothetical protein